MRRKSRLRFSIVPRLTTHSTGARISLIFIDNLAVMALCARPVNSGVRRLLEFKDG